MHVHVVGDLGRCILYRPVTSRTFLANERAHLSPLSVLLPSAGAFSSRLAFAKSRIETAVILPVVISIASSPNTSRHVDINPLWASSMICAAERRASFFGLLRSQRQLLWAYRTVHGVNWRLTRCSGRRWRLNLTRPRLEQPWGLHAVRSNAGLPVIGLAAIGVHEIQLFRAVESPDSVEEW